MKSYSQDIHAIKVNQIGYTTNDVKTAFVANKNCSAFEIKDVQTNETVYQGKPSESTLWNMSEEN
ncbi:MAG: hypothetical protein J6V74_01605, partial [Bacteroidales bacterium]|nr:hypothetical protein [Bacteroidales bacterium]